MSASNWKVYNKFKEYMADGTLDLDGDSFKFALFTSAYTPAATDSSYTTISGSETANGNGYTTGGVAATGVTWTETSGTLVFDANDPSWVASGGSIVARYVVLYDDTDAGKALVAYSLLDTTPADVTTTSGNTLLLQLDSSGVFTLTGGWA